MQNWWTHCAVQGYRITILFSEDRYTTTAHVSKHREQKALSNRPNPTIYYPLLHTIPYDLKREWKHYVQAQSTTLPPSSPSPSFPSLTSHFPCRSPPLRLKRTYETIHENDSHFHWYRFQLSGVSRGEKKNAARLGKKRRLRTIPILFPLPRPPGTIILVPCLLFLGKSRKHARQTFPSPSS